MHSQEARRRLMFKGYEASEKRSSVMLKLADTMSKKPRAGMVILTFPSAETTNGMYHCAHTLRPFFCIVLASCGENLGRFSIRQFSFSVCTFPCS